MSLTALLPRPLMTANNINGRFDEMVYYRNMPLEYTSYSIYLYPATPDLPDELSRCSRRLFSLESTRLNATHIAMQSPLVEMQIR